MSQTFGPWRVVRPLGSGGQAKTFLVSKVDPEAALLRVADATAKANDSQHSVGYDRPALTNQFFDALHDVEAVLREQGFGVAKVLHAVGETPNAKALERMEREVRAYREVTHPNLIRLLDENVQSGWIVTEYQREGTLAENLGRFRGDPEAALSALIPLVDAVAALHEKNVVHRDIKPENIFVNSGGRLVLGDAGIAYFVDDAHTRLSETFENVGSRDWMPGWAQGIRLDSVRPTFDLYSIGKVLWAMVAGEPKLQHWYFKKPRWNLERRFPDQSSMKAINSLLARVVVEEEESMMDTTASGLLKETNEALYVISGGPSTLIDAGGRRVCSVCRRGRYERAQTGQVGIAGIRQDILAYFCTNCGHVQTFMKDVAMWKDLDRRSQ